MPGERDCVGHLIKVKASSRLGLEETVALGLLVFRKWDRANAAQGASIPLTSQQASAYDNFTEDELQEFRSIASRMLVAHAVSLPRHSWWSGVW